MTRSSWSMVRNKTQAGAKHHKQNRFFPLLRPISLRLGPNIRTQVPSVATGHKVWNQNFALLQLWYKNLQNQPVTAKNWDRLAVTFLDRMHSLATYQGWRWLEKNYWVDSKSPESLRCWTSLLTGIVVAGNLSVTSWVVMPARLALCDLRGS